VQGRLTTTAHFRALAAILLQFKKEILEAPVKANRAIINVIANETWAELKILVPYDHYYHPNRLWELRQQIVVENPRVVIPPLSIKWMRAASTIESHYQAGCFPKNAASVIFKVPSKIAASKLLVEMWVAGNKLRALPYIPDRADTLYGRCGQWGQSEFRCHRSCANCAICAGVHRTEQHRYEVSTYGKVGKVCPHTEMKFPNCGGGHPTQDARCHAKHVEIEIARGRREATPWAEPNQAPKLPARQPPQAAAVMPSHAGGLAPLSWVPENVPAAPTPDRKKDPMDVMVTGTEPSGTAPPVAV